MWREWNPMLVPISIAQPAPPFLFDVSTTCRTKSVSSGSYTPAALIFLDMMSSLGGKSQVAKGGSVLDVTNTAPATTISSDSSVVLDDDEINVDDDLLMTSESPRDIHRGWNRRLASINSEGPRMCSLYPWRKSHSFLIVVGGMMAGVAVAHAPPPSCSYLEAVSASRVHRSTFISGSQCHVIGSICPQHAGTCLYLLAQHVPDFRISSNAGFSSNSRRFDWLLCTHLLALT